METYKQMKDALSRQLLFCAKQKKDKPLHLKTAEQFLESGADANYKNSRCIYFAVKNYNFPFVKLLIRYGALESDLSRKNLAAMCEKGGFNDKREEAFFELIDYAIAKTGFDPIYIAPYINMMFVAERTDKLAAVVEKFGMSLSAALSLVKLMIIFEAINLNRRQSLQLINAHLDWKKTAIDVAVATGHDRALEYILSHDKNLSPSEESVTRAVAAGHTAVLQVLKAAQLLQ